MHNDMLLNLLNLSNSLGQTLLLIAYLLLNLPPKTPIVHYSLTSPVFSFPTHSQSVTDDQ